MQVLYLSRWMSGI